MVFCSVGFCLGTLLAWCARGLGFREGTAAQDLRLTGIMLGRQKKAESGIEFVGCEQLLPDDSGKSCPPCISIPYTVKHGTADVVGLGFRV